MTTVREPTDTERQDLIPALMDCWGYDSREATSDAMFRPAAVFDGWMDDGPGYVGKVLVLMGGFPGVCSEFTWDNGTWTLADE